MKYRKGRKSYLGNALRIVNDEVRFDKPDITRVFNM
jgi:hypothetical protein